MDCFFPLLCPLSFCWNHLFQSFPFALSFQHSFLIENDSVLFLFQTLFTVSCCHSSWLFFHVHFLTDRFLCVFHFLFQLIQKCLLFSAQPSKLCLFFCHHLFQFFPLLLFLLLTFLICRIFFPSCFLTLFFCRKLLFCFIRSLCKLLFRKLCQTFLLFFAFLICCFCRSSGSPGNPLRQLFHCRFSLSFTVSCRFA